ncbi:MAG: glutamine-hydrolyzing carbamoyl-phosphate synthase small subunit [Chloroflexota bacterium]|nr:glutamine-hydrolyzing carbamoyl-phosphate synthase small subunit [Chloroflexota bacterium]
MRAEPAVLALATGDVFFGYGFGSSEPAEGEVVFNTSMTGYQEITTDASYRGQIVTLTYPLINNYGVNADDVESRRPWIAGLVVRELAPTSSNWRAAGGLGGFLEEHGIAGIMGIDTRSLVRVIRRTGPAPSRLVRAPREVADGASTFHWLRGTHPGATAWAESQVERAQDLPPYDDQPFVSEVTVPEPFTATSAPWAPWPEPRRRDREPRIALLDIGVKTNIVRSLARRGAEVRVLPYGSTPGDIAALQPDGVVVGNGPGDPVQADRAVETVRAMIGRYPLMGICLGHQVLGLAIGATTSRLPFGHRGANHPVQDLTDGRVHITSQNHGFQVDAESIPADSGFAVSHVNLNDGSVEGLSHERLPVFSVQYHPEASPGPQDNQYLFDRFLDAIEGVGGQAA